jgi:hypothetical protein
MIATVRRTGNGLCQDSPKGGGHGAFAFRKGGACDERRLEEAGIRGWGGVTAVGLAFGLTGCSAPTGGTKKDDGKKPAGGTEKGTAIPMD